VNIGVGFYMGGAQRDGIGWAITHLLRHLLHAGSAHRFTVFTNLDAASVMAEFKHPPNLEVVSFSMRNYTVWEQVGLPLALRSRAIDVFHSPLGLPVLCRPAGLTTIHDLCFLTEGSTFTPRMRLYFRTFLPLAVRRARLVLTVSEASATALSTLLGVRREKIRVVPNGVEEDFQPHHDRAQLEHVRDRYGLPTRFMLYVGTLEPRKNVLRLLQACARVWSADPAAPPLVIVGKTGWLSSDVFRFVEAAGLRDRIVFAGYVDRQHLPAVYALATVFVYPSLCEGFGLPPVEAMASGTPVIASNASALAEVLGPAARLVDPRDAVGLADAIRTVLADDTLRRTLRDEGLLRAARYRWDTSAERVLEVYGELTRASA
jgi:glycosyltransferase involved in cell wall biosynthesis